MQGENSDFRPEDDSKTTYIEYLAIKIARRYNNKMLLL